MHCLRFAEIIHERARLFVQELMVSTQPLTAEVLDFLKRSIARFEEASAPTVTIVQEAVAAATSHAFGEIQLDNLQDIMTESYEKAAASASGAFTSVQTYFAQIDWEGYVGEGARIWNIFIDILAQMLLWLRTHGLSSAQKAAAATSDMIFYFSDFFL